MHPVCGGSHTDSGRGGGGDGGSHTDSGGGGGGDGGSHTDSGGGGGSVVTHHAGGLDRLAQAGGVGLTPEHVADEVSRALGHDEGEGVDVLPHAHEGQEAHAVL